ncbi:MAG: MarR family winged helix-turn-helix transcriptional regulator [Minisyncoccia bacterium]
MNNRERKVKELMEGFQSLSHSIAFSPVGTGKIHRITPSQWGVLMMIEDRKESTVKDVANVFNITSSAATQLVDGLVNNGHVIREEHAEDRRQVALTLSKNTKTQMEKMKKQFSEHVLKLFEVLSDKEFNQFVFFHKKIFERHLNK